MSHDIARINGNDAIAYVGASPWHRLGTVLESLTDLPAALTAASINWTVTGRRLYALTDEATRLVTLDGQPHYTGQVSTAQAQVITRDTDGTHLGIVGPDYTPIQHTDAFKVIEPALAAGLMTIECAGALGANGATVWLLCRLTNDPITVRNGTRRDDVLTPFLCISTAHDGSRALRLTPTFVRVVCRNTIQMHDADAARGFTIHHRENAAELLKTFGAKLDAAVEVFQQTGEHARAMAQTPATDAQIRAFMETLFPLPAPPTRTDEHGNPIDRNDREIRERLYREAGAGILAREFRLRAQTEANARETDAWDSWLKACERVTAERAEADRLAHFGNGNGGGTIWDALNGVTEFLDHTAPALKDGTVSAYRLQKSAESSLWGNGATLKAQAWRLAQKAAQLVAA